MNFGPLALSTSLLTLLFGIIAGLAATGFLAKRGYANAGNALYLALGGGLLFARMAYVARWWPQYGQQPASVLNLRDAGFDPIAGVLGLLAVAALISWRRPGLRRPLLLGVTVGIAAWAFGGLTTRALIKTTQLPLPTLIATDVDGHAIALEKFRGQPTVINLWASWCGPCRREMPVLAEAQRNLAQIRFVFADQGESATTVKAFLQGQQLSLDNVLIDENMDLSRYYHARGYQPRCFSMRRANCATCISASCRAPRWPSGSHASARQPSRRPTDRYHREYAPAGSARPTAA